MKTILILSVLCALCVNLSAGDEKDKIVRDTSGKVVATINQTATGVTVRDSAGAVTESRQRSGNTITVRDSAGAVILTEEKARK
jgi:hypothetical protein